MEDRSYHSLAQRLDTNSSQFGTELIGSGGDQGRRGDFEA
jgi:hypothetical protein